MKANKDISKKNVQKDLANAGPYYCINRRISEEEALICLAEGWSTLEPLTDIRRQCSYYAKAFKKIKSGSSTWNWAAALGGWYWLEYKRFPLSIVFLSLLLDVFLAYLCCELFSYKHFMLYSALINFVLNLPFGTLLDKFLLWKVTTDYKKGQAFWNLQGAPRSSNLRTINYYKYKHLLHTSEDKTFFLAGNRFFDSFLIKKAKKEYEERFP